MNPQAPLNQFGALTVAQLGIKYGLSRSTIYRLMRDGRLPYVKIGRLTRFRPDAGDVLLKGE